MIAIFTALASNLQDSGFSAALVNRKICGMTTATPCGGSV